MKPTKEQIIEWAMSAGFLQFVSGKFTEQEAIEQFAATVYAEAYANGQEDMRERCAKVAFDADHMGSVNLKLMKNRIGNAIRALPIQKGGGT